MLSSHLSIRLGNKMCNICSGMNSEIAGQNFSERIERFEGKIKGIYIRALDPVECECSNGHTCYPSHIIFKEVKECVIHVFKSGGAVFISKVLHIEHFIPN